MAEFLQTLDKDQIRAISPFLAHLDIQKIEIGPGHSRLHLDIGPEHTNRNGAVHGGVIASLLDVAAGTASSSVIDGDNRAITVSLNVDYIQSASAGDRLTAEGRVVKRRARIVFAEAVVRGKDGEVVAKGSAVMAIRPRRDSRSPEGKV